MSRYNESRIDRRRFFRTAARGAVLAALTGTAVILGRRRFKPQPQSCDRQSVCRQCPILGGCELPQAHVFRKAVEGEQS